MMKKLSFLLLCLCASIGLVSAQTTQVTGVVVSAEDGEPVIGASVAVQGTTTGTVTDMDGEFTIGNLPASAKVLVISYIGMQTQEVAVAPNVRVTMNPDTEVLEEVVVVAYGTAKKSAFTGSAAVVNADELSKRVTTNVTDALVGSVPGLQLRGGSGEPGVGGGNINIRGIASMYAGTSPLIIVDGAPFAASLSNIPQNDIESISVLKDAASAALYGARGAAGVIIITTKKGNAGKAVVNVDMKWGTNTRGVQDYDVITDPGQYYEAYYAQLYNYSFYGQGNNASTANTWANNRMISDLGYNVYTVPDEQLLIGADGKLNPKATLGRKYTYNGTEYYMQPDNWTDMAYKSALRQEYNLSVNGATDRSSFYASLGYLNEDGIIEYSGYERINARLKADYQMKDWLKITANAAYIHSERMSNPNMDTSLGSTNLMYYTTMIAPIYPVYVRVVDPSGNVVIKKDQYGNDAYDYGVASTNYGVPRAFLQTGNPLGSNRYNEVSTMDDQLTGIFMADANLTSFLKFSAASAIILGQTNTSNYQNPFYGPKVGVNGEITKGSTSVLRTNHVQTMTYLQDFGLHSVTAMLGHEYYKSNIRYLSATAQGGFSPDIKDIDAFANKTDSRSYTTKYNVEGFFASAQYDYDEKYYASASFRRDATSYFAKENRWGNFWSVGGAWLMNKETFMDDYNWIDMLKLKLSIGQQGNDNIHSFAYTDLYSLSKASDTAMSPSFYRMGNPEITWETTTNFNAGIEFGFWEGRLTGNVDIYNKTTTDLLFWLSIPESAGSRGYYGNMGDIRNTGVELVLAGSIIRTRDIDWSVSMNLSHNKTKILSLPEAKIADNGGFTESNDAATYQNWFEVGGSLYTPFMAKYAGVNDKGMATYWVDETLNGATNVPGTQYSSTTTNFNQASKYKLSPTLPDLFGGFGTTLTAYGFDATIMFDYQLGGKTYDYRYRSLISPLETTGGAGSTFHKDYIKSWSPNNTSSNMPRWQFADQYSAAASDRFLVSASYLNFQSFTVGYTIPERLLRNISVDKIRIYAAGENLGFWSARKGLDPRYSYDGNTTVAVYSPVRNISGGIQLTF
ncbi:MAG: SusC/RagA family TonB-linked outer membrane protein [Tannerellaceae bacterium]|jgi:TonB-linked SusC/RagA family outer membrane protein|nr:SusC/RagA family TonB-linked outer membrane protein [Tannerellaceae bacterium]